MPVTSSTIGSVPVWQFSGAVTDAEIKTAWSALITNGVYVINRAIYLDSTADISAVTGGFLVDFGTQVSPAFVLHTARDKSKSTFNNFTFLQRTGLVVTARTSFVQTYNGTTLSNAGASLSTDGLSLKGGGFVYGVVGNPGGADPRFLNEMGFRSLDGVTIYSQEFTEQELQPCVGESTVMRGLAFEKAYGFPQIGTPTGNVNVVVYRSTQNTQGLDGGGLIPIRLFPASNRWAAACYVDSYVTRNGADITTRLINGFGSTASSPASLVILNNYTRESWFGASKATMAITSWTATNLIYGGVLKKLQFVNGGGGVVRAYDSRSTTTAQKCKFAETGFIDFMDTNLAPTTDAEGKISIVHVGAIASGGTAAITRYTGQKYTFQKFGYRVIVGTPDMTSGDNDLSSFTPIVLTTQSGIARTQAAITAATTVTSFQDLLEELHVLATTLTGSASYAGAYGGNLFDFIGGVLTTSFASVVVDAAASAKIAFDAATNTLTVKSSVLSATETVRQWSNPTGTVTVANGAKIEGVYETSAGLSTILELRDVSDGAAAIVYDEGTTATDFYVLNTTGSTQTYRVYYPPGSSSDVKVVARERYGYQRVQESLPLVGGFMWYQFVDIPDVGITEPSQTVVEAYTSIDTLDKFYEAVAAQRICEPCIKKGQVAVRSGTAVEIGGFSVVVDQAATSTIDLVGTVITIRSTSLSNGAKYNLIVAAPPATVTADTNEVITANIEDGAGDSSVQILGGDGTFELWKIPTATATDDYTTGTLLATVGNGRYRFIGVTGFDIVGVDINSNIRRRTSMAKGVYSQAFYVGEQIQLAQQPEVYDILERVQVLEVDMGAVKGAGFTTANDSLNRISAKVTQVTAKVEDNTDLIAAGL